MHQWRVTCREWASAGSSAEPRLGRGGWIIDDSNRECWARLSFPPFFPPFLTNKPFLAALFPPSPSSFCNLSLRLIIDQVPSYIKLRRPGQNGNSTRDLWVFSSVSQFNFSLPSIIYSQCFSVWLLLIAFTEMSILTGLPLHQIDTFRLRFPIRRNHATRLRS